jgi:hypothetical protein
MSVSNSTILCTFNSHDTGLILHFVLFYIGDMKFDRTSRCICKNGPVCHDCSYCLGCSCRCHSWFTLNFRLFDKDAEQEILQRVESVARTWKDSPDGFADRHLDEEELTTQRLDEAKRKWGHDDERI